MPEEQVPLPCTDKMAFDTQGAAEASALTVSWQHGTTLTAYLCQHCSLWHLSSSKRSSL